MRIDASWLTVPFSEDPHDGLCARFHPDGTLHHLGLRREGRPTGPQLDLDVSSRYALANEAECFVPGLGGDVDRSYRAFVLRHVTRIQEALQTQRWRVHCAFCEKSQKEVRKMIAGPRCYICDECVSLCSEILSEEDESLDVAHRP